MRKVLMATLVLVGLSTLGCHHIAHDILHGRHHRRSHRSVEYESGHRARAHRVARTAVAGAIIVGAVSAASSHHHSSSTYHSCD